MKGMHFRFKSDYNNPSQLTVMAKSLLIHYVTGPVCKIWAEGGGLDIQHSDSRWHSLSHTHWTKPCLPRR